MAWMNTYYPEESVMVFEVADGDHRVKIVKAENQQSKSGLNMHVITLKVEGANMDYLHFICEGDFYNKSMTAFFDGFAIQRGNFQLNSWIGKVANAHFQHKEEQYTDKNGMQKTANKAKLVYFHKTQPTVQQPMPQQVQTVQQTFGGTVQNENIPF